MRFLHTADWHLGRTLHGASLIDDQAHLLGQLVDLARDARPDALLVAGDVYDRAVPPPEAVGLLSETLCRLVVELGVPVVMIAGNHDSPSRMGFASRILRGRGLHILGPLDGGVEPVTFEDAHGEVSLYPLPYADPATVRYCMDEQTVQGHQQAMRCLLEGVWARHPRGHRAMAMAHCFVAGASASESERPLSVGGAAAVEPGVFEGFHYVALGHLHRPQSAGAQARYSGSLMRYSFSETDHDKAVLLIEMDAAGACRVEPVALSPRRQVRCVKGTLAEVLSAAADDRAREDYLMVTLADAEPVYDAMGKLRQVYPNVLHIDRPMAQPGGAGSADRVDHRKLGDLELFGAFFREVTGETLSDALQGVFIEAADAVRLAQREADA